MRKWVFVVLLMFGPSLVPFQVFGAPVDPVDPNERCAVCGMLVAKYDPWITQLHASGEKPVMFDGVKDMMAYFFNPSAYSGTGDVAAAELWVKDYYTLAWQNGRTAVYVVGSDVMGPMGEELVPFASREAAENFLKDHKGTRILAFDEIDADLVMSMKKKHMKKMKKMKRAQQ